MWWPCVLRLRFAADRVLGSRVQIPFRVCMFVCCVGEGICDELITRSEESCRVSVSNCGCSMDVTNEAAWVRIWAVGPQKEKKKKK
jgi:hypothetical protein